MQLLIGLDIGTTAEKIALFDQNGKMLAVSTQEYDLITPAVNYVEEEPEIYWESFKKGLEDLKQQHLMTKEDSYALAISAQGETLFFLDGEGRSLRNAIVWMDNRAEEEARSLKEAFGDEECYRVTGQVSFEPCWPASKILWVKNHEPEVFTRTRTFALIEDYFIHRMTGVWGCEGSLVCSTTYWNILTKKYWKEVLDFMGVTEELGLGNDVTICTGCLDQVAGAIGIGNIHEGMFSENIGAALAIVCPVSRPMFDPNRSMPLHYFAQPDTYMIHTFTNGGMTQRWFRDKFCQMEMDMEDLTGVDAYSTLSSEATKVPAGSDGLVMLPHLSGSMAPDMNAKAKGVWFGFTLQHTKGHFIRSIYESLGYMIRRNIDALDAMGLKVKEIRSSGGGSKSPVWNQIKSDILGIDLVTTKSKEAASLGAAILAGKAVGLFPSLDSAVQSMAEEKDRYRSNEINREVYNRGYQITALTLLGGAFLALMILRTYLSQRADWPTFFLALFVFLLMLDQALHAPMFYQYFHNFDFWSKMQTLAVPMASAGLMGFIALHMTSFRRILAIGASVLQCLSCALFLLCHSFISGHLQGTIYDLLNLANCIALTTVLLLCIWEWRAGNSYFTPLIFAAAIASAGCLLALLASSGLRSDVLQLLRFVRID